MICISIHSCCRRSVCYVLSGNNNSTQDNKFAPRRWSKAFAKSCRSVGEKVKPFIEFASVASVARIQVARIMITRP